MPPPPNRNEYDYDYEQNESDVDWSTAAQYTRGLLQDRLRQDPTLAGPLLRLAFHDATTFESLSGSISSRGRGRGTHSIAGTGGPNGSVRYELEWPENRGLSKPLAVVDSIFQQQNQQQLQQQQGPPSSTRLSVADITALAGAVAVESAGGPWVPIQLGRIDAVQADAQTLRHPITARTNSDRSNVTRTMPSAAFDSDGLRLYFQRLGLTEREWVALSGTHGLGRHVSLLGMSKPCLRNLTRQCLEDAPVLLPFVSTSASSAAAQSSSSSMDTTDASLSNSYYKALLQWYNRDMDHISASFLPTDVAMVVDVGLRKHVHFFAEDRNLPVYFKTLVRAYQKLTESTATTVSRY
jgi:L-ascorbate peroxidase